MKLPKEVKEYLKNNDVLENLLSLMQDYCNHNDITMDELVNLIKNSKDE